MAQKKIETEQGKFVDLTTVLVKVKLRGTRPILLHNGQLADPLNEIVQRKKEITAKKKQARDGVASEEALAKLEFEGGLYIDADGDVYIPGENIAACIRSGGTLRKKGTALSRAVRCFDDPKLQYPGIETHKGAVALLEHYQQYSLRKRIVNSGPGHTATMRTRPMFKTGWTISFDLTVILGADVDLSDVKSALEVAGSLYGLGDWNGRYGLFEVEKFAQTV